MVSCYDDQDEGSAGEDDTSVQENESANEQEAGGDD
ncbi:hypothetical protein PI125_g22261 [Phytophthora idaei]|nr:hypothetical protein PI125_g22261 [Phytophthora idaei]